jgi:prevent-host-death family protein
MRRLGAYEAKTHLPRLLDEVAAGEPITITKHGVPVAVLVPTGSPSQATVLAAIAGLRSFRKGRRLDGVSVRELIEEGRR